MESLYVNIAQIRNKGIAERTVRRVREETSAVLLQSGRISPYVCERPVATASVRLKSLARYISRLCVIRVGNLARRHYDRRH